MLIEVHPIVSVPDLTDSHHYGYLQVDEYMQLDFITNTLKDQDEGMEFVIIASSFKAQQTATCLAKEPYSWLSNPCSAYIAAHCVHGAWA